MLAIGLLQSYSLAQQACCLWKASQKFKISRGEQSEIKNWCHRDWIHYRPRGPRLDDVLEVSAIAYYPLHIVPLPVQAGTAMMRWQRAWHPLIAWLHFLVVDCLRLLLTVFDSDRWKSLPSHLLFSLIGMDIAYGFIFLSLGILSHKFVLEKIAIE